MIRALDRRAWIASAIAALITLAVALACVDAVPVGGYYDDAMYVILAKSLATGHGLRWLNLPGAPAATHFPPGYPAVLALLWLFMPSFPANVIAFKIANACFLAVIAVAMAVFARRRLELSPASSAALAVASTVSIPMFMFSTQVMSEPLFLAMLLPILLVAEDIAGWDASPAIGRVVALGVAVGLLALVRTQAIAVAAAVGLMLLARRRYLAGAMFGIAAIAVLVPWQLWVRAHLGSVPPTLGGNYETYFAWIGKGFRQAGPSLVGHTLAATAGETGSMFVNVAAALPDTPIRIATILTLAVFGAVGTWRLWIQARVTTVFLAAYMAMVLLWPGPPTRFIAGVWPLIVAVLVIGALASFQWRPTVSIGRLTRVLALAGAAGVAYGYVQFTVLGFQRETWAALARHNADAARPLILWARRNMRPDAVIATELEPMVYLYADRRAIPAANFTVRDYFRPPTSNESAEDLRAILASYRVDAVAVMAPNSLRTALDSMAMERQPEMVLRDSVPNGLIYTPSLR